MLVPFHWGNVELMSISIPTTHLVGAIIFIIASVTDFIDGYYARKLNLVTNLGKFLDPLADKLLVSAALIILVDLNLAASWIVIIIISREFAITGLRAILAGVGEIVAAAMPGKIKMWTQIIAIAALLLHNFLFEPIHFPFATIALWISMIFTIWSGWDYIYKNRFIFTNSK
jgi:CDP-diacylglycerol---glycerol-3-phosphate 3-phosphatidyltransferase